LGILKSNKISSLGLLISNWRRLMAGLELAAILSDSQNIVENIIYGMIIPDQF